MACLLDKRLGSKLEEIKEELVAIVNTAGISIRDAQSVLEGAGVKPKNVNSPHIYQAEAVRDHAKALLNLLSGNYTYNLPALEVEENLDPRLENK